MSASDSHSEPKNPDLIWRDDGQPVSVHFDDPYFSVDNGLEESHYVFLRHNGLPERWQGRNRPFRIIETGFGTGLNFLLTWQSWREHQDPNCEQRWLHFTSIEKFPLSREQLTQALALWPQLGALAARLIADYPLPVAGFHHMTWPEEKLSLTLIFADVKDALPNLSGPVHAWYLDGFAPSKNPQMWSDELFHGMRLLSQQSGDQYQGADCPTVATFTSAGLVRRGLLGAGFNVSRVKGYGRKREMLAGAFNRRQGPELPPYALHKPWLLPVAVSGVAQVTIIGAGIAGATTARALAERGIRVTVLDRSGIAQGGSGNPQGGLYVKLAAADQAIHTDFYLAAYLYALPYMQRLLGAGDASNPFWQQCGVLQLAYDDKEAQRQARFADVRALPDTLVRAVTQEEASQLSGSPQSSGGLFFPAAGWASPVDTCKALLDHPLICFEQRDIDRLEKTPDGWRLWSGGHSQESEQVVIASAYHSQTLLPEAWLPLKSIRGQLSYLDAARVPPLNTVVCGRSYMAPACNGIQVLGATYNLRDDEPALRDDDHLTNLHHLADFGPDWAQRGAQGLDLVTGGRVAFRCTTPDYLPMVGAVPDPQAFIDAFGELVRNAKRVPAAVVPDLKGLWLNTGLGSRGLASAPLCAELLAAQITGDGLPVGNDIAEALWPGRFLLRDMIRRKLPKERFRLPA
ncbi:bifunctional tRNA (5-methylaminomethyl-2-thiouridine)(34)-methyltransferase MnmD/FAD-dependent 5-carboxymethylaminomethyl-2-thiouridine(34) oxidoreductase MnmC [Thalassolituus sp. LLYu03]|uniref:bifunctional tRNA (5-methylaminomethyl-2-thiouridine)(34)-methyltransferase MnmD/FAD-dependent 5-carboxymethylaminomethyl-2-thiouridine(34) oxidoreductase MnmC n=1 Tax=Thalassolituus sp. LLYu03 TaxID=3421656 RepID=UPI003D2AFD7B